jgi:hypothetical protein
VSYPEVSLCLLQIYALRELHEELSALFSQEEAAALGLPTVLAPFARLPALHVSSYTAAAWHSAHSEHERRLEAVEERVSQKLKELFGELIPKERLEASSSVMHMARSAAACPRLCEKQE